MLRHLLHLSVPKEAIAAHVETSHRLYVKRIERLALSSSSLCLHLVPTDRSGVPIATIIYNPQHSPYVFEDLPPAYHSLADIKKDLPVATSTTTSHTNVPPATTVSTNVNEAAAVIIPSAPTPPPPSYTDLPATGSG